MRLRGRRQQAERAFQIGFSLWIQAGFPHWYRVCLRATGLAICGVKDREKIPVHGKDNMGWSGAVYHVMNRGDRREPIFKEQHKNR